MINEKVAKQFIILSQLFTLRDAKNDFFRVRSSQNTAQAIESLNYNIDSIIDFEKKKLTQKIPGVGKNSEAKIIEIIETGSCQEIQELFKEYPKSLLEIMAIKGVGPKTTKGLYEKFQIQTVAELKKILEKPELLAEIHLKEKSIDNIKQAINQNYTDKQRTPISKIYDYIKELELSVSKIPHVESVHAVGSFRRLEKSIGDIDIIICCHKTHTEKIIAEYTKLKFFKKIINQGSTKVTAISTTGVGIDLRIIEPQQIGACLQYFTGNRSHNIQLRQIAKDKGYKINEYGLFTIKDDLLIESQSESKIYELLGLQFVPPTLRHATGEIKKAQAGQLEYIQNKDISYKPTTQDFNQAAVICIKSNKEQAIEKTIEQVLENKDQQFIFDPKDAELAILILQKCGIQKSQVINCQ